MHRAPELLLLLILAECVALDELLWRLRTVPTEPCACELCLQRLRWWWCLLCLLLHEWIRLACLETIHGLRRVLLISCCLRRKAELLLLLPWEACRLLLKLRLSHRLLVLFDRLKEIYQVWRGPFGRLARRLACRLAHSTVE